MSDDLMNLERLALDAERDERVQEGVIDNEPEPEPEEMPTAQLCAMLLTTGFGIVANRKGNHWLLSESETQALSEATAAVVDKYMPDSTMGVEAALVLTAGMMIAPRLAEDAKKAKEQAQDTDGKEPEPEAS